MSVEIRNYILKAIEVSLGNDTDNLNRAALQQVRMPFDHDNNDYIDRLRARVELGRKAHNIVQVTL